MIFILVRIGIAAMIVGVCPKTLRRWEKQGKIRPFLRTAGGHRRYETTTLGNGQRNRHEARTCPDSPKTERVVGYTRVSSTKQKEDLERQQEQVKTYIEEKGWKLEAMYQDVASGLNDRRQGLNQLLKICQAGHIDRIIITYDDRLARFGTHIVEWLVNSWGVKVERIQPVQLEPSYSTNY